MQTDDEAWSVCLARHDSQPQPALFLFSAGVIKGLPTMLHHPSASTTLPVNQRMRHCFELCSLACRICNAPLFVFYDIAQRRFCLDTDEITKRIEIWLFFQPACYRQTTSDRPFCAVRVTGRTAPQYQHHFTLVTSRRISSAEGCSPTMALTSTSHSCYRYAHHVRVWMHAVYLTQGRKRNDC